MREITHMFIYHLSEAETEQKAQEPVDGQILPQSSRAVNRFIIYQTGPCDVMKKQMGAHEINMCLKKHSEQRPRVCSGVIGFTLSRSTVKLIESYSRL